MLNNTNRGHLSGLLLDVVARVRAKGAGLFASLLVVMCAVLLVPSVMGQGELHAVSAPTVTASATTDRVRFVAPGAVLQMHLQVYDNGGQLVFDVSSKGRRARKACCSSRKDLA
jgi:hypothetical protein